jgi:4-hydroxyphenylpyruvate dioxygenase
MADLFENPLGTDGFEFVEFTSPDPDALATYFRQLGFTAVSQHRSKNVIRFKQGDINFILNMEPLGQAAEFREQRGPSANAMAFRVKDAAQAFREAIARGAGWRPGKRRCSQKPPRGGIGASACAPPTRCCATPPAAPFVSSRGGPRV